MAYKKNHYNWLPDPEDLTKDFDWTRASEYIDCLEDKWGLVFWLQKMVAYGIATREDLQVLAASTDVKGNSGWYRIIEQAKEASGGNKASNLGTAFHAFREAFDKGEQVKVPTVFQPAMSAYKTEMKKYGFKAVPELVERNVVHRDLKIAGTFDNVYELPSGELVIADTKTNQDTKYGALKRAMQMALYANAPLIWDAKKQNYEPLPKISKEKGYIIHIPSGGNTCTIIESNLKIGWEAVQVAGQVHRQRGYKSTDIEKILSTTTVGYTSPEGTSILDQLLCAPSVKDLESIWNTSSSSGTWTEEYTKIASQRKKDLLAPRQKA